MFLIHISKFWWNIYKKYLRRNTVESYKWMTVDGIFDAESQSNLISRSLEVNFLVDQLSDMFQRLILEILHTSNRFYSTPSKSIVYYNGTTFCLDIYLKYIYFEIFMRSLLPSNARDLLYSAAAGIAISTLFILSHYMITTQKISWIKKGSVFLVDSSALPPSFQKIHSPNSHSLSEARVCHMIFFGSRPSTGYVCKS